MGCIMYYVPARLSKKAVGLVSFSVPDMGIGPWIFYMWLMEMLAMFFCDTFCNLSLVCMLRCENYG